MPMPRMAPIRVCELETGNPSHQVERFQAMPDARRARTMMIADFEVALMSRSTGRRWTMLKAIAVPPTRTPRKLQKPGKEDGRHRPQGPGVDHGRHGVGRVVKAVDDLEPERDDQGHRQDDHAVRVEVANDLEKLDHKGIPPEDQLRPTIAAGGGCGSCSHHPRGLRRSSGSAFDPDPRGLQGFELLRLRRFRQRVAGDVEPQVGCKPLRARRRRPWPRRPAASSP